MHASPETIAKLQEQGLKFETKPGYTLNELFMERRAKAETTIPLLPPLPEDLPHALKSLYEQIRECMFFGLHGAAITLSGNLIEFGLKHFTYLREIGGYKNYDPNKWDQFEKIKLYEAINRARRVGLIDKKLGKRLQAFREDIRNPYSHYNIRKITRDVIAGRVKVVNTVTGEVEEKDLEAKDHAWLQAQVKPWVDERQVLQVFHFADEIVKYLFQKSGNT